MTRRSPKDSFQPRIKALSLGIAIGLTSSQGAGANPSGPTVAHGNVSFSNPNASTLNVTNTPNSVINWQGFSIGANETTRFIQQSAASRVLNRVSGGNPSKLMGRLLSNGKIFLINSSGIIFGPDSVIDTAGFLASTLNISDRDFIEGRFSFNGGPDAGGIDNQGYIRTGADGEIILIAPEIENSGIIEADGGRLVLAAGHKVTLTSLDEDGITFEVQAPEDRVVNLGELLAKHGSVEVFAGVIENKGTVSANSVEVDAQGRVILKATHRTRLDPGSVVAAAGGDISITVDGPTAQSPDAGFLALEGDVRADGRIGGHVDIDAGRILATGTVSADGEAAGGRVEMDAGSRILATADSRVSASGDQGGGGNVALAAGDGLYTSGRVEAGGQAGGRIEITGGEVKLAGATVDASGPRGGGEIRIGGGRAGGEGVRTADTTWVNQATTIDADAKTRGDGGSIVVWGDEYSNFAGRATARGGRQAGDGGLVEISSKESFDATGTVDVLAPKGANGVLVLDPKNFIIEPGAGTGGGTPTTGAGVLSLVDPNPGAGDNFGNSVSTIDDFASNLLWVMNPNDDLSATDSGAVYAFDTVTGALRGAVVGANAGDMVGNFGISSVSGSTKRVLRVPNFNGGQGLVTTLNPASPPTGVLGTGNSLVGTGNPSFSSFGSGIVYLASSTATVGGNANAGYLTFYNVESPPTGLVSATNSLVGANAGDFVGSNFPTSVSGSSRYLVNVPNFNAGQGAITTVDPFNFVPRTVGAGNSLVGTGSPSSNTFTTAGNVLLWSGSVNVAGETGYVTTYNVDTPANGTLGAGNALIGVGNGGGFVSVNTFTLGSTRPIISNSGFDPTGGSQPNTGFLTVYDVTSPLTGTVGPGNALIGENSGDLLGNQTPQFVSGSSGSNYFLNIPNYNGGQGAVTAIAPFDFIASSAGVFDPANALTGTGNASANTFTTAGNVLLWSGSVNVAGETGYVTTYNVDTPANGTLGAGNALIGVGNGGGFVSVNTSTLGSTRPIISNSGFDPTGGSQPNTGFLTVYDVTSPLTGSVDATKALIGANANDFLGNSTPQFVSGSTGSNYFFSIPNYNGGQGAVTAIAPFDFIASSAGVFDPANALVGTGSPSFNSFITGGNVLLWNSSVNVAGETGYVTTYNVDTPANGNVGAGNALIGVGNGGGSVSVNTSTLGSTRPIISNSRFDPTGGSQPNTGFLTVYDVTSPLTGTVDATKALIGANANDFLGNNTPLFVSGSSGNNYFLRIPNYNNSEGAVTTIAPFDFIASSAGVFDPANALTGTGNASANTFVGGGNVLLYNPFATVNGVANAGFINVFNVDSPQVNQAVGQSNSLVGGADGDLVGNSLDLTLANGALFRSQSVDIGGNMDAGAYTFIDYASPATGLVGASNSVVGANANDRVGSTNATFVSGSAKYVLQIPFFNNGEGAVTVIDPGSFQPRTVSTSNSLVGTAGIGINSSIGSGIVEMRNSGFDLGGNTNVGFLTYYDVNSPFTGTVGPSTALVGSNTNDSVGSHFVATISGGSKRLLLVPNFNSGQGAVRPVDPFNFTPGTVTAGNSFVGVGDSVNYTSLGGGDFLLYGQNADVGGTDRGFITKLNIDTLGAGTVSAANSLVGANDLDRVGNPFPQFVSGSTRYLLRITDFNNGQGAVTSIDPNNFQPGVVSTGNSLVGTGNPSWAFAGNGNVVLYDPLADLDGLTDNGYATVYSVDSPLVGLVSQDNSMIGAFTGDMIGSSGVNLLSTGNALVRSPLADGSVSLVDSGRLDILDITGISGGGGGTPGFDFASDPGGTVNVGAESLKALLASGTSLKLQSNNDIMVMLGALIDGTSGSGSGGSLSIEAGRSIIVDDDIIVDGDLALLANLSAVPGSGVQGSFRDAGSGDLIITDAVVSGNNLNLSGANVIIDPSTVSANQDMFVFASGNFSLLDDSSLQAGGDLGILAFGDILVRDSAVVGQRVLALGANVTVAGATGTSLVPSSDYGIIEGRDLVTVAAVGSANIDDTFRPALANLLGAGVTLQEFADALTAGSFTETAFADLLSSLTLAGGTLDLAPGTAISSDALVVSGEGTGPAIIGFGQCNACLVPLTTDPFLDEVSQAGIWADPILFIPIDESQSGLDVANELLRLISGSAETLAAIRGEDEEEDEEGDEDLVDSDEEQGAGEEELQECR